MVDPARIEHLRGLAAHLSARIRGQDHLIPRLASCFGRAALSLPDSSRPAASLLLVGPTGTGKSRSFELACDYTFGPNRFATFDMSEYQSHSAVNKLIGETRDDPGLLGRALEDTSICALLFDEIEKAHAAVMDLFLQILWRGCITVATGRTYRTSAYVIGFTSNLGAVDARRIAHSTFASIERATLRRVGQALRPELVGRLDEQLVFACLNFEVQREICALEVTAEISRLRKQGYDLVVSSAAMDLLIRDGFHPELGARPLKRTVASCIQDAVLRSLFSIGTAQGELVQDSPHRRLAVRSVAGKDASASA